MATLKELKVRINGIKGTQKITKAMKMVASAKLRRAQDRIISARPFARKVEEMLSQLVESVGNEGIDELLEKREIKTRCVVIVSSDRGLAGSFNTNVIRNGMNYLSELPDDTKVITVGKKVTDSFRKRSYNVIETYPGIFNDLTLEQSNAIVEFIVDGYKRKDFDAVDIIYNEFKSIVKQVVVRDQFFPFKSISKLKEEEKKSPSVDYIFEPDNVSILKYLVPKHLRVQFWKILLESNAAEQAARMTAMETATKNAADLLQILELSYNQARQASITKEILEIVGGAEALKEA
ncbi:MAG: ATP synthase F1 subunit gamma [Ignavibacteria bacterium]|nr:ATP synthase F1 subunit gamma [Ignavibacteria bacterium]